jgi:hypothetical protein
MNLDPASAAQYALVAICLVLTGALLTIGVLSVAERGTVLAGIIAVLIAVSWRARRQP